MKWWYELRCFRNIVPAVVLFILIMLLPVGVVAASLGADPLNPGLPDSPSEAVNEAVQGADLCPAAFVHTQLRAGGSRSCLSPSPGTSPHSISPDAVVITAREGEGNTSVEQVIRQTFPGWTASPVIEGADPLPGSGKLLYRERSFRVAEQCADIRVDPVSQPVSRD